MTYNIHNIEWDATESDVEANGLPSDCIIEVDWPSDIADELSDIYGFCVNGFTYDDFDYEDDFGNVGEVNAAIHDMKG